MNDQLELVAYDVDAEPHIRVDAEICCGCEQRPCLIVCPAQCYRIENNRVEFSYHDCLECGSCRIVCDREAITWSYPRGGFGVCYRLM